MILVFGEYVTDDGLVTCALSIDPDTFSAMAFASPPINTMRRPHKLLPRKEVFINATGHDLRLPYPTTTPPVALGTTVTLRGDPTYFAFQTLGEINRGEAV